MCACLKHFLWYQFSCIKKTFSFFKKNFKFPTYFLFIRLFITANIFFTNNLLLWHTSITSIQPWQTLSEKVFFLSEIIFYLLYKVYTKNTPIQLSSSVVVVVALMHILNIFKCNQLLSGNFFYLSKNWWKRENWIYERPDDAYKDSI